MIAAEAFLEWRMCSATSTARARQTRKPISAGRDLVLVIDVQGARRCVSVPSTLGVFVLPPSFPVLESRLRGRSADSEAMQQPPDGTRRGRGVYGIRLRGRERRAEACVDRLRAIVLAERSRLRSMRGTAEGIVKTFIRD
jgi:hypothetical protein